MLSRYNVAAMMTEYDGQQVAAVSFKLEIQGKIVAFKLPCNWRAVAHILKTDPKARRNMRLAKNETIDTQAIRTAWRIIAEWMEAQLALVEIGMTTIPQIFLPYSIMRNGKTLGETIEQNPSFLLNAASEI